MEEGVGWRLGVDIGGTFTDLVAVDPQGALSVFKVPSVPADPAAGVIDALERCAAHVGLALPDLLARCSLFAHGSTIATNTLLERKGARVGCVTSAGFRDSLEIRRGIRDDPWAHRTPYPPVLAPRYLRVPVRGRIDADGVEHTHRSRWRTYLRPLGASATKTWRPSPFVSSTVTSTPSTNAKSSACSRASGVAIG